MAGWEAVKFDTSRLSLRPLSDRESDVTMAEVLYKKPPITRPSDDVCAAIENVARAVRAARANNKPVILFMGGHLIKSALGSYVSSLLEDGYITHVATNGACIVHEWELVMHGATSESVARYIDEGQFGLWRETSYVNDIVFRCVAQIPERGLGHIVASRLYNHCCWSGSFTPQYRGSVFASCYLHAVPLTCHVLLGGDINHSHPNFDGAAWGQASHNDFLVFAEAVRGLNDGGVFISIGSAVHGPEVFLKALSMARNVGDCAGFTTVVFDIKDIPGPNDRSQHCLELQTTLDPGDRHPLYYFRPWKTLLVRAIADRGTSCYVQGLFDDTVPELCAAISNLERTSDELH